ncbi:MAG: hypothetical protein ABSD20_00165 [Terriglobales bacterium]
MDLAIEADVGPDIIAGSTRLKAGTAQKMICNMLITGCLARLGYVYGNLMVNVQLKNKKLFERGISILQRATGVSREEANRAWRFRIERARGASHGTGWNQYG